jgi:hypothetical protein
MGSTVQSHAFVALPLLRAIEQLPDEVSVDGITLRFTGAVERAGIVADLYAFRAACTCGSATGWVDLSPAASWRTEMSLRMDRLGPSRVNQLLLALRAATLTNRKTAPAEPANERMTECRSA